ncbi:glucosyltransferase domain-containing protein [Pseudodesulfovibrio nedwellii]|nr:glucosyltransferase domain-containing protein [Pseudodesulfovibrio nedwellii]
MSVERYIDSSRQWFEANRSWFVYLLAVVLLSYTYELFNFTLTIDDENWASVRQAGSHKGWLQQARWGMHILSYMFNPNPVIPFSPLFLSLICMALSYTVVVRLLAVQRTNADYLCAPIFIACSTLYYSLSFSSLVHGIGIGFLACSLGIYCLVHKNRLLQCISVLLAAFAISIYQAFLPVLLSLYALHIIGLLIGEPAFDFKRILTGIVKFIVWIFMALLCYYVLNQFFLYIFGIEINGYIGGFVQFQFTSEYFSKSISLIVLDAKRYYLGKPEVFGYELSSLKYTFLACLLSFNVVNLISNQKWWAKLAAFLISISLIFLPFLLHLMNAGRMPVRSMLAFPLVLTGFLYFSLLIKWPVWRLLLSILIVVCAVRFSVVNNQFTYSNILSWQSDNAVAIRLLERIDSKDLSIFKKGEKIPIVMVGYLERAEMPIRFRRETIGASFFEWDRGNVYRVIYFINTLGEHRFFGRTRDASFVQSKKIEEMPTWPMKGCVEIIDAIVVIKFK